MRFAIPIPTSPSQLQDKVHSSREIQANNRNGVASTLRMPMLWKRQFQRKAWTGGASALSTRIDLVSDFVLNARVSTEVVDADILASAALMVEKPRDSLPSECRAILHRGSVRTQEDISTQRKWQPKVDGEIGN
ncbi:hypothetical protein V494_00158 [Pseudogymnoascus sp. VKM F-4513 (FW-928)]|nr:hypothetical protein V494_00158 [Pseudogymnoascus sp. VKM F-4513 (FW-928)]